MNMDGEQAIRDLLKELSSVISRSLSTPETLVKLERLQQKGYQLYLIMEPSAHSGSKQGSSPVMPIQIFPSNKLPEKSHKFRLTDDDKDFLRTLKIKVD